jgi:hypothetical protein
MARGTGRSNHVARFGTKADRTVTAIHLRDRSENLFPLAKTSFEPHDDDGRTSSEGPCTPSGIRVESSASMSSLKRVGRRRRGGQAYGAAGPKQAEALSSWSRKA